MLTVLVRGEGVYSMELTRALELGRQRMGEPGPYAHVALDEADRVIIAELSESTISRRHVAVCPLSSTRIRVANLSAVNTIWIDSSKALETNSECECDLPVFLTLGNADLAILVYPDQNEGLQSLALPTAIPGAESLKELASLEQVFKAERGDRDSKLVISWLRNTMEVFQSAASSADFLSKAARAVIDIVGLQRAAVMRWQEGKWDIESSCQREHGEASTEWKPSQSLLERVRQQKRTFWKTSNADVTIREHASLLNLEAYVASPILNSAGAVIGAVYGERGATGLLPSVAPITELEAMLVELLSCSVAAGLARIEQEQAAIEARVLFEQFFTPELSQQLQADPLLLSGRDADVTVLFCDIRGFSRISERIGAALTFDWINSVMGTLSDCVIEHKGVLVDYIGDELVAMWGAPEEMAEHASCACRAALAMIDKMPGLSAQWQDIIGEPTSFCVGVNTGPARVGNTGCKRKFKYGPLGNTVNLASRVQGATKFVRTHIVITGATAQQIGDAFPKRRLCCVEVVNIAEPIVLYELRKDADHSWDDLRDRYESALGAYEQGDFLGATRILGNLLTDYPDDGPTVILLSRAVDMLAHAPDTFSPIWKLSGK